MKKLLLALGLLALCTFPASAQCIAVGGINNVPQPGITCGSEPIAPTYGATGVGIVPAASATDIACLTGSATRTVRVQRVTVSGTAGTLITVPVTLTKHVSANTAGTPATSTALPVPYAFDSTNAAVSATAIAWTANPTINDAAPGIIASTTVSLNTTAALVASPQALFDWAERNFMQAPILRGVAQQLCVNLNATSPSSGLVNVSFTWTELAQ